MSKILRAFVLAATCAVTASAGGLSVDSDPTVPKFAVKGISAVDALLELSRSEHLPMGIVEDDDALCKSIVSYSAENVTASVAVEGILAQVPGYTWRRSKESDIFLIAPVSPRSVTVQFLQMVDPRFGPTKDTLQGLEMTLWVHVRYILYPDQGTAGSILSSSNARAYELGTKDATIEQILDRIAIAAKGAWVLRPLPPTLANLSGDLPFSIFSDDGQGARASAGKCVPLREAGH